MFIGLQSNIDTIKQHPDLRQNLGRAEFDRCRMIPYLRIDNQIEELLSEDIKNV